MRNVIVAKDFLLRLAVANAVNHRSMVQLIRKDDQIGNGVAQRRERGVIGPKAGGEQQRGLLAVGFGQQAFQLAVVDRSAGNTACPAGTQPDTVYRLGGGQNHLGVMAHRQIVIGAPDVQTALTLLPVAGGPGFIQHAAFQVEVLAEPALFFGFGQFFFKNVQYAHTEFLTLEGFNHQ
ncbi:hypothetical protein D3C71_1394160 [compost metagenome]